MVQNKRKASGLLLILGLASLAIGIGANIKVFSWAAVVFVLVALVLDDRWWRPRRK